MPRHGRFARVSIIMADKAAFRAKWKEIEQKIPEQQRVESDKHLQVKFLALPQVGRENTVMLYLSMGREVETGLILEELSRQGKRIVLPRCLPAGRLEGRLYRQGHLVCHSYGMWEPDESCPVVEKDEIGVILVPALCYDRHCFRMGRGGGYYDRYLADYSGFAVGLCRDSMLQQRLPRAEWDIAVDLVLTRNECIGRKTINQSV